ncbi:hypothetical protein N7454_011081 [Penicillium verhagenii]|nr:hypothetical protein N7454_011081 [Penicillium verhagenii]
MCDGPRREFWLGGNTRVAPRILYSRSYDLIGYGNCMCRLGSKEECHKCSVNDPQELRRLLRLRQVRQTALNSPTTNRTFRAKD